MKRHLELASHGHYASGALSALQVLIGKKSNISGTDCYVDKYFDLQAVVKKIIEGHPDEELIVVTDIFGGSVNNEFMRYISDRFFLIAGMNLPFLLELVVKLDSDLPTEEVIASAVNKSQSSLKYCNKLDLSKKIQDESF